MSTEYKKCCETKVLQNSQSKKTYPLINIQPITFFLEVAKFPHYTAFFKLTGIHGSVKHFTLTHIYLLNQ